MLPREARDVDLEGHRSDGGAEVEEASPVGGYAQPVREVPGVGQGGGEAHHAEGAGSVRGDEVGAGDDHLGGKGKK